MACLGDVHTPVRPSGDNCANEGWEQSIVHPRCKGNEEAVDECDAVQFAYRSAIPLI